MSACPISEAHTNEPFTTREAHLIGMINCRFLLWLDTLEEATERLAEPATTSTRASTAHHRLRNATQLAEAIATDLFDAQDALEPH